MCVSEADCLGITRVKRRKETFVEAHVMIRAAVDQEARLRRAVGRCSGVMGRVG